jgi:hypothetical protein
MNIKLRIHKITAHILGTCLFTFCTARTTRTRRKRLIACLTAFYLLLQLLLFLVESNNLSISYEVAFLNDLVNEPPVFSIYITTAGRYLLRCDRMSSGLMSSTSTFLTVECDNGVRTRRPVRVFEHTTRLNNISLLLLSITVDTNRAKDARRLAKHDGFCHIRLDNNDANSYLYGGESYYASYDYSLYAYENSLYEPFKADFDIEPVHINHKNTSDFKLDRHLPAGPKIHYIWTNNELDFTDQALLGVINEVNSTWLKLADPLRQYVADNLGTRKLFLSMTTNPKRIKTLHYTLSTIDFSNVDTLFISLPFKYRNTIVYQISRQLAVKFKKIKFLSISSDIGPVAKILPAVEHVKRVRGPQLASEDLFISIDDDNAYHATMVNTLAYFSLIDRNAAFGASARLLKYWFISPAGLPPSRAERLPALSGFSRAPVDVLQGFGGIVYRGHHFDLELIRALVYRDLRSEIFAACYASDDFVISFFLAYNNVQLNQLPVKSGEFYGLTHRQHFPFASDDYALHLVDARGVKLAPRPDTYLNVEKYNVCYQQLVATFLDMRGAKIRFKTREQLMSL